MADRFYCPDLAGSGPVVLEGDEAKHLARVARREVGEVVEVFDGRGYGVLATIAAIEKHRVVLDRGDRVADRSAAIAITLMVSPPKGDRFDWLVEKATEIGVARLVPIKTARSVVDPRTTKLDRLRRLVIEASKQCGRATLMEIEPVVNVVDTFGKNGGGERFIAHAHEHAGTSANVVREGAVTLVIGPEGGWTQSELDQAVASGWKQLDLGGTRLRIETAAIVGAARLLTIAGEGQN